MSDEKLSTLSTNSPALVQAEIDRQWDLMLKDPNTRQLAETALAEAGQTIKLDQISTDAPPPFVAESAREGSGAGIVETVLVKIAVNVGAAVATAALTLLWKKVIGPQIEKRFGKMSNDA